MQTQRRIRSFVLRAGRTTAAQERALSELWPTYGIDLGEAPLDLAAVFGREAPRCLEIGFGAGEVIGGLAETHSHIDYLGIEVHRSGVGRLLLRAEQCSLKNSAHHLQRRCRCAARSHPRMPRSTKYWCSFPIPGTRSAITNAPDRGVLRLARGGKNAPAAEFLRLATDWQAYAEQMLTVCNANPALESLSGDSTYVPRPSFGRRRASSGAANAWPWCVDLAYAKKPQ